MAVSRTLFRNIAMHVAKPSHIVETMNANISEGNEESMFVTFFIGVLDLQTGCLCYCNAGHNAPFVESTMLDCNPNIPIGVMPDWKFTEQEIMMTPGTTIFLYTDGLTEAENANLQQFGEERMTNVVTTQMADDASPQTLIEAMAEAVHQFVGDTEQSDDLTMLAIKYTQDKAI
jgi:sigma-B regulation protein RsbU (phosphoserine phosphatase)